MTDAKIIVNGNEYELPVVTGSEGEVGIDMAGFRAKSKTITLDPGFGSTGSAKSAITYIDGENGVLHYRGYPIEQLAGKLTFEEVIYLLIWGELPTKAQLEQLNEELAEHSVLPEAVVRVIHGLPRYTHPMATAQAATAALSANAHMLADDKNHRAHMVSLIAKMKALTAGVYRDLFDYPLVWPNPNLGYAADFLNLMYARPGQPYEPNEAVADAFNKLLILHADHEQNCSASAVRTVASSQANLYASVAAGIGALWGPLHGGANQRVLEMLEEIHNDGGGYQKFIAKAKDKNDPFRLMGFGHRVYKNYDPRAKILKESTDRVLEALGKSDPLLDIAKGLEQVALADDYFVERKLFPNVDFYSGIIYRALGIPVNMFTVMFALGRLPGWIAQWKEQNESGGRIWRPRQIYTGATKRDVTPLSDRG